MRFQLLESNVTYPNKLVSIQKIANDINIKTEDTAYFFSHFEVDGVEIYEDYQEYLTQHINSIQTLVAHLKTKRDLINETIMSLENYITNAIPEIQLLAEEYYQIANQSTWKKFQNLITGIEWVNNIIIKVDKDEEKPVNWDKYIKIGLDLQMVLRQLLEGLNTSDEILIADILQFEINPIFERITKLTEETLDIECKREFLN